jgi:sortase A
MIVCGLLLLGSSVAIPASQAIQEANMRSRIAEMTARAQEQQQPAGTPAQFPAMIEPDEDDDETERDDPGRQTVQNAGRDNPERPPERPDEAATGVTDALTTDGETQTEVEPAPVAMPAPIHVRAPSVGIDAPVVEVGYQVIEIDGQRVREWEVASHAAGHHNNSARPGEGGNVVITGHNDWEGEVFRSLDRIEIGQDIFVTTEAGEYRYVVSEVHLRREVNVTLEERLATGGFIASMPEERLTLVTCWPYGINDHRVIIVAHPAPWPVAPPDAEDSSG